ncbi:MAG: pseudouridine synthase, partial [Akkermansia sp.]
MPEKSDYPGAPEGSVRLNKFLASCGYESRRAADRLIQEGRVEVNGKVVDTPGLRVVPSDFVKVDGHRAEPKAEVVLLLNKPRGFVCSREKQGAEKTVYDLLPAKYRYVNYIGRLDTDSEGLLLFTNNGELSRSLAHPAGGVEKEYWVTLDQAFDTGVLMQLLKGVRIPEGQAKAKYVSRLSPRRACVVLEQGLKRQVRQMFACLGLRVRKLVRVRIGSLWGGDLEPGHTALLTPEQVALAGVNPRPRKGMVSAKQAFKPKSGPAQGQAPAEDDDEDYVFNPADFESDAEVPGVNTKFEEGEMFEPERENPRRPFGKAPRGRVEFGRRKFDGERRGFGDRKPFGDRKFDGERRGFGDRKPFGDRKFDGERRGFGDRKPFGERKF